MFSGLVSVERGTEILVVVVKWRYRFITYWELFCRLF